MKKSPTPSTKRELYRAFCENRGDIGLFQQAWWLDALCGPTGWDVALCLSDGKVIGALPYADTRRFGLRVLSQPALTQSIGPWILPTQAKTAERLSREKDIMEELIRQLPPYAHFSQAWSTEAKNWLPFYWAGFSQTTHYSYAIEDLSDEKKIWSDFQSKIRGDIRKAESRFSIAIKDDPTLEDFLQVNGKTFERQSLSPPYTAEYFSRLDASCAARNQRKIFIAEDGEGRVHAGAYIVWDSNRAYYIAGGGDPELRNSGATSYCMWQAIRFAATVTKVFDFEGSMMEPVERFFRGFGATQVPYFFLHHTPSKILKLRSALRSVIS